MTASALVALFAQGGCAVSDPTSFVLVPDGGLRGAGGSSTGGSFDPGTGGDSGTGGTNGTGGTTSTGGFNGTGGTTSTGGFNGTGGFRATGGFTGSGGVTSTGGFTGSGGVTATGGVTGTGGVQGTGGVRATGGTTGATGGTTGAGGAGGSAPTFTQIYQTILTVSCGGNQCHNPGTQGNVSFASQSSAYSAVKSRVIPGNATGSSFYMIVNSGKMPAGAPKLSAALLSEIAAWINAGALNN